MKAMIRWWCMSFRALTLLGISSAVAAGGCGTGSMTLAQELAWEQWNRCDKFPNVKMDRMEPDGRIWVKYHSAAEFREWNACVTEVRAEQGRRKVAVVLPAATAVPSSTPPVTASFSAGVAPLWRVGDEWAFRWEQPDGAGTFVWSVDRLEAISGVDHFVVKSGDREVFYRVSDRALALQKVSGEITERYTPVWMLIPWPLAVGAKWEERFTEERPKARVSNDILRICEAEAEETVTVPAGTFQTMRVVCRNQRSGALVYRRWYAAEVKHMVREEWSLASGIRTRELLAFKLKR